MKVAIYVVHRNAKESYINENYQVRKWPGMSVIKDVLERSGIHVGYCSPADVHEQDIVLFSLTANCDWWPFIKERIKWKSGKYKVIIGGAGILNIRPFLEYADFFVFGRAETFISEMVKEVYATGKYEHPAVASQIDFSPSKRYEIWQAEKAYPYEIDLEDEQRWQEFAVGCQNKCLFCGYTWHRKNLELKHEEQKRPSNFYRGSSETTMMDLVARDPLHWKDYGASMTTSIDGFSERLRKMVNKPITREIFKTFLAKLSLVPNPGRIRVYNLVGLPTETKKDWDEFREDLNEVDSQLPEGPQWGIELQCTPFKSFPTTPAAHWKMSYENYRGEMGKYFHEPGYHVREMFNKRRFWVNEGLTESVSTQILDVIALRGTEKDVKSVKLVACTPKFWALSSIGRQKTLENYFDVKALFSEMKPEEVPTNYLHTWWMRDKVN